MSKHVLGGIQSDTMNKKPAVRLAPIFGAHTSSEGAFLNRGRGSKTKAYLHYAYKAEQIPKTHNKIAAFDMDGTVIKTKSGNVFPTSHTDWTLWHGTVKTRLRDLFDKGFLILFISNQSARSKTQIDFEQKVPILCQHIDVPMHVMAAWHNDKFRKPSKSLWDLYISNYVDKDVVLDEKNSFFVGDAAGRPGDHSDVDRKLAHNIGITFYTPEEFFLSHPTDKNWEFSGWDPAAYDHTKCLSLPSEDDSFIPKEGVPQVILFVGPPASGKTTVYESRFKNLGYHHVNQDTLKTRAACLSAVKSCLEKGESCVVDNTNPSLKVRAEFIEAIRSVNPDTVIHAVYFDVPLHVVKHNNVYRTLKSDDRLLLPLVAFNTYYKNVKPPTVEEGFSYVHKMHFKFAGSDDERKLWESWLDVYPKSSSSFKPVSKK